MTTRRPLLAGVLLAAAQLLGCGAAPPRTPATPAPPGQTPAAASPGIRRTLLERHVIPGLPGWESRLYLIEYDAKVAAPVHWHPVPGVGYVISGCFESAFGEEATTTKCAGDSFVDTANADHRIFRNSGDGPLRFVISYVLREGDSPLIQGNRSAN